MAGNRQTLLFRTTRWAVSWASMTRERVPSLQFYRSGVGSNANNWAEWRGECVERIPSRCITWNWHRAVVPFPWPTLIRVASPLSRGWPPRPPPFLATLLSGGSTLVWYNGISCNVTSRNPNILRKPALSLPSPLTLSLIFLSLSPPPLSFTLLSPSLLPLSPHPLSFPPAILRKGRWYMFCNS